MRHLLIHDPSLCRAEYEYTPPLHFAVREGHLEAVDLLLTAGADPGFVDLAGDDLMTTARDHSHKKIEALLENACAATVVNLPLASGAEIESCGDEPWATPAAWATRRAHHEIADLLRRESPLSAAAFSTQH